MRVLVVEDEKRLAAGIKRGLEAEGFATDVALNGTDGLWMARENPYAAIVLDIMLPGMNGYQVCAALREEEIWTPIMMLTAKDGEFDEAEALDTGADDYVTKPFSYVVLVARLRALIRRGAGERPAVLEAGDLGFDPGSKRAWRSGAEVDLTAREMALLEFLLRRKESRVEDRDPSPGVGLRFRGRPQHRRGLRPAPQEQVGSPLRAERARDGSRVRVSVGG